MILRSIGPAAALLAVLAALQTSPKSEKNPQKAAPQVGKPAPTFRLNDHRGRVVTVGGETDHWTVLAFFPKAATPG